MQTKEFFRFTRAKLILFGALSLVGPVPFWGVFYIALLPPVFSLITVLGLIVEKNAPVIILFFFLGAAIHFFIAYLIACIIDRFIVRRLAPEKATPVLTIIIIALALLSLTPIFTFRDAGGGSGSSSIIKLISDFSK